MMDHQGRTGPAPFPGSAAARERIGQSLALSDLALTRIVNRSIVEARNAGRDHDGQTRQAVQTVRQVRPDLSAHDALDLVQTVRN